MFELESKAYHQILYVLEVCRSCFKFSNCFKVYPAIHYLNLVLLIIFVYHTGFLIWISATEDLPS